MLRVDSVRHKSTGNLNDPVSFLGTAVLKHDERHLRRKAITLTNGTNVLIDLAEPVVLASEDQLLLEDGSVVEIQAADEPLYAITISDPLRLMELIWHIGNRHLPAEIFPDRIVIGRDHVIKAMLEGLGATVTEIVAPFSPVKGAYAGHNHSHSHHEHSYQAQHHHD